MAKIEAIDNLRRYLMLCDGEEHAGTGSNIGNIADAIQREIDERFIALPLDADGMPIHIGDNVWLSYDNRYINGTVSSVDIYKDGSMMYVMVDCDNGFEFECKNAHHGRHIPTVTQLLDDMLDDVRECNINDFGERLNLRNVYAELFKPLLSKDAEV